MKAKFWQRGDALDYKNTTTEMIPAGTVVSFGGRISVAGSDIPAGGVGSLNVVGVFEVAKKSGVTLSAGDNVAFTEDGMELAGESDQTVGYAVADAVAEDETVKVKLMG